MEIQNVGEGVLTLVDKEMFVIKYEKKYDEIFYKHL